MAIVNPSTPEQNGELLLTEVNGRLDKDNLSVDFINEIKNPTGCLLQFAGSTAPAGYLLCDGSAINRTVYADLFAVIGTTYGAGDGTTTFGLPDLRGRVPMGAGTGAGLTTRTLAATGGAETHTLSTGELPSHDHSAGTLTIPTHTHNVGTLAMGAHSHSFTPSGTLSTNGAHTHTTYANQRTNAPQTGAANVLGDLVGTTGNDTGSTNSNGDHTHTFTGTAGDTGTTLSSSTITGSTGSTISANAVSGLTGTNGSGTAHNNVQPFVVLNYIIKT